MAVPGLIASWPRLSFAVAWNVGGLQAGTPLWTDLTWRMQGQWTANPSGRQYEQDAVTSGTAQVVLDNTDGGFDSTNPASPYSGFIKPFRKARFTAVWPPTQNLLPQSLATGTGLDHIQAVGGTTALAAVAAAPTGATTAQAATLAPGTGFGAGLGATNASFPNADSDAVPIVTLRSLAVGLPFTGSVYLSAAAAGTTGLPLFLRISWYRQDGTRIATTDSAASAVPLQPSWTRYVVTGTAPAGAVWARLAYSTSATTTVTNTVYSTGWQFEQAGAVTAWADPGVTYPVWTGYLERTKQQWPAGPVQGTVTIPCVDSLAGLSRMILQQSLQSSLLALGPGRLYPLDEPTGSTSFRDLTGTHAPATTRKSIYGAGTLTAGNSITGQGFVGASGPVVTMANPAPSTVSNPGSYIELPAPYGPPSSGGWSRIICFRTTTLPAPGQIMALWTAQANNLNASSVGMFIDNTGEVTCYINGPTGQAMQLTVPVPVVDGNWHMAAVILTPDGKTLNANVDGAGFFATSAVDCHTKALTSDVIGGNVSIPAGFYGWFFTGDIAYAVEVPTDQIPSFSDVAAGFATGWAGETSARRAQRILAMAGWTSPLAAGGTTTLMGAANVATQDAVSSLQVVADSESGQVYVDVAGNVSLSGRLWRFLKTAPEVIFGENTAAGELPYLGGGISVDVDPDHIYNSITVTNQVAPNATQPPDALATVASSTQEYFTSSLPRTINVLDPDGGRDTAQYLASQYAEPQPRISQVTFDPTANPTMWPKLLSTLFGTRARLMRRPNNSPNAIQLETFVESVAWKGDDTGRMQVSLQLSPASPYQGWWVVAAMHTTLQATATAGASTITLGALTGSALNTAKQVLPGGTVLTVGYGTTGAETVTVQSVGATVPGYTSVVVTLTGALARTHTAGQTVCEPLPAGVQLPALTQAGYPASLDAAATLTATTPRIPY